LDKISKRLKKKLNRNNLVSITILLIDVLLYLYFSCFKSNRTKMSIREITRFLQIYNYIYKNLDYRRIKKIVSVLFPIYKNNHKGKRIKIDKNLLVYWCRYYNVDYSIHEEYSRLYRKICMPKYRNKEVVNEKKV
jgi:hypothetical protein